MKENKKHKMKFSLKTKRLILKPRTLEEMKAFYEGQSDEHLRDAYKEMYDKCIANEKLYFWYTNWAICLKDGEKEIGSLGVVSSNEDRTIVEIGYGIDEEYRGNGYCTEAVKSFTDWLLSQTAYFVRAETDDDNEASKKVLLKNGFKETEDNCHFEIEKPATSWVAIYMCLGLSVGMSLGMAIFDNMATGMSIGMLLGVALGYAMDASDKKKRKELKGIKEDK